MPLPHLLKYVYNNGTEEVIRRGKRIFATGGVNLVQADPLLKTATFRVRSDTHSNYYHVSVNKYHEPQAISVRCQCPYNLGEICRHEAAALFHLQEMLDKNRLEERDAQYNQQHTVVKMRNINLTSLKLFSSPAIFNAAEKLVRKNKVTINEAANEKVKASVEDGKKTYSLVIRRNVEHNYDTQCNCDEKEHPLCKHKMALFLQLLNAHGPYYFDSLRNWDKEKNMLLASYGYSLKDNLEGKFAFSYVNGKPFLRVLDNSIKKVNTPAPKEKEVEEDILTRHRIGVVFNANEGRFPYFNTDLIAGEVNEEATRFISLISQLDLTKYINYYDYPFEDRELIALGRKLQQPEVNKFLNRNSPFADMWENIYHENGEELPADTRQLIIEYLYPKLSRLWPSLLKHNLVFYVLRGQQLKSNSLQTAEVKEEMLAPHFKVSRQRGRITINSSFKIGDESVLLTNNEWNNPFIFLYKGSLYLMKRVEDIHQLIPNMAEGALNIPIKEWPKLLKEKLIPLSQRYHIDFDKELLEETAEIKPEWRLYLSELGDTFILQPRFGYLNQEAEWDAGQQLLAQQDGNAVAIQRDKASEEAFISALRFLHENFQQPSNQPYFHLKAKEALAENWFFRFFDKMKEMGVKVYGHDKLKNFRFNINKPETQLQISSGMDWFEANVQLNFGDNEVSVREVKKALAKRQNYIELSDGTLGLLPEDWISKYSLLFRMGEESDKGLRISKFNFGIIDELYEHLDDNEIALELEDKKKKMLQAENIPIIPLPENSTAILRPYQEAGFQWLNYLSEIKWGGILADDMGLGKTVQALTFMQHYKNKYGHCLALVVCPTSLVYNWENEIKKFTPDLIYHIHHGPARNLEAAKLVANEVILTTYGTLRSDIKMLKELKLDYVVLDESQAIKNPHSKVTKAAQVLNAKNRVALSGTPMQNNTFDIYAQMNFLNPGMLGSIDFFRNEFANPIDKFQDQERKEHLRKIIYPFILRRTKEQVARDLPEKTETVLFCEMDPTQRHIYDAYRNLYRSKILGAIEDQGLPRSQFTILQGLMKLRQICDSPAILNEPEEYPNHSVKLHELTREIIENVNNHKALVFSQFLGMLALIRERLERLKIPYEYFDGSTSTADREKAITNFQENDDCRVFLISLKAGGVGLNLTAADYVYIVDPWWNPAVEQQAIDRTHRIGQTKNILAYRMICKDTVEEKILELQEKKKSLVKDIIADDNAFVKKLTKEDVLYLFS